MFFAFIALPTFTNAATGGIIQSVPTIKTAEISTCPVLNFELNTGQVLIIEDEFLTHIVAFHSQQAIEKSLKAILENESQRIPRVHRLVNLMGRIDLNISFDEEIIEILDELYIDSRYPNDMGLLPYGKPTLEDGKRFYEMAQQIFDEVCSLLEVSEADLL